MSNSSEKRLLEREALRSVIQQWNANRVDLFELSEPNEDLEFHGVMRFYFQDSGQKVATKCIRVASDATVADVIETLIEKFRPDMRMLSLPNYALYEVHSSHEERKLSPSEKPLLVQLNWHIDDREGRFLLRNIDHKTNIPAVGFTDSTNFKRKLSKREKKELKKKEKLSRLQSSDEANENQHAEKLYTEMPETSFTRSISNPEAVMRRRRHQKLERKLQQFRSKDGGPDTGGTLKIYGESLCRDVPYKTLLLSIRDCSQAVVREMLSKYGLDKADPMFYCLVQVNGDGSEYILDDDECPLAILMNHPSTRGSIMFHVRRRPADMQPRRRKKKPLGASNSNNATGSGRGEWGESCALIEVGPHGQLVEGGRKIKIGPEPVEVGSAATVTLQLFGPMIQPRHCLISQQENICTVTPLHADALTFVNGHRVQQTTILHHASVVMFGRVASFKYYDPVQDGRLSRHLAISQSQLDNNSVYDRSTTSPIPDHIDDDRPLSPVVIENYEDYSSQGRNDGNQNEKQDIVDFTKPDEYVKHDPNAYLKSQEEVHSKNDNARDNFETTFDLEGNVETKSISSAKSGGSNQESRTGSYARGQEMILPAVLEFSEPPQEIFLRHIITDLDVNAPTFKLAPVYTLYLCARYRASTHYRPELQPTERAHKLTNLLHHIANIIQGVIQERFSDAKSLSFWMANSSELLHFLKSDRHISAFSIQAQDVLAECVQGAFRNLVACFHVELSQMLGQFLSENIDHDSAAGLVLSVLSTAMALLRRCRVNAALTIQLFSQLFHYINVRCFNKVVTTPHMCTMIWGNRIQQRLAQLQQWAERQGLELAADCHLAKIVQCTNLLQAPKSTSEDITVLTNSFSKLNSLQISAILSQSNENVSSSLIEQAIRNAESKADELTRAEGREIRLEESPELPLALMIPDDGYSCDVVKGVPAGLVDFLQPLQAGNLCRLAIQPTSIGNWTVYMHQYHARSPSALSNKTSQPEIQVIKLHKNSNGMGLSIVAAKGAGQERLGIYIKSVVPGGAADSDQRLQAGDQLLRVDGQSLIGITQEKAAEYLVRTGAVVTLEVAKQGAIYHGLATLLQQPSPLLHRGSRGMSDKDLSSRVGGEGTSGGSGKPPLPLPLPSSKSVPALHHVGSPSQENLMSQPSGGPGLKSHSTHNLANPSSAQEQGFYQNLSVYRANSSHPNLGERGSLLRTSQNSLQQKESPNMKPFVQQPQIQQQQQQQRPSSAYFGNIPATNQANVQQSSNFRSQSTKDISNFSRENQNQLSIRMNQSQLLAPSMPNIPNSNQMTGSGYLQHNQQFMPSPNQMGGNVNQSMSNINLAQYNQTPTHSIYNFPSNQITQNSNPHENLVMQNNQLSASQRGLAKMAEIGEEVRRRQNRGSNQGPLSPNQQPRFLYGQDGSPYGQNNILMSPNKMQPTIAPKPQSKRPIMQDDTVIQTPPLPPSSTHPLYISSPAHGNHPQFHSQQQYGVPNQGVQSPNHQSYGNTMPNPNMQGYSNNGTMAPQNYGSNSPMPPSGHNPVTHQSPNVQSNGYAASIGDAPKVNFYPTGGHGSQHRGFVVGSNPWEREEREKEMEARREQARHWRDQQITDLAALPNRTSQQEDQLRALKLEREFQRRAQEAQIEEDTEQDKETSERVQGLLRLAQQQNQTLQKQEPKLPQPVSSNVISSITPISIVSTKQSQEDHHHGTINQNQNYQTANENNAPQTAPKSILKQNLRLENLNAPNKNTHFAENQNLQNVKYDILTSPNANVSQISKNMANMNLNKSLDNQTEFNYNQYKNENKITEVTSPPPPPERNSSFQVMTQQNAIRTSITSNLSIGNSVIDNSRTPNSAANNNRDNKRVSFHDNDPAPIITPNVQPNVDLHIIREDPNRFITEAEGMLQSPQTPDGTVTNTPGVIGAQEVYRDPRTRMLLEQQKQAKTTQQIPEKLSFKEKMKMFALESGNGT